MKIPNKELEQILKMNHSKDPDLKICKIYHDHNLTDSKKTRISYGFISENFSKDLKEELEKLNYEQTELPESNSLQANYSYYFCPAVAFHKTFVAINRSISDFPMYKGQKQVPRVYINDKKGKNSRFFLPLENVEEFESIMKIPAPEKSE